MPSPITSMDRWNKMKSDKLKSVFIMELETNQDLDETPKNFEVNGGNFACLSGCKNPEKLKNYVECDYHNTTDRKFELELSMVNNAQDFLKCILSYNADREFDLLQIHTDEMDTKSNEIESLSPLVFLLAISVFSKTDIKPNKPIHVLDKRIGGDDVYKMNTTQMSHFDPKQIVDRLGIDREILDRILIKCGDRNIKDKTFTDILYAIFESYVSYCRDNDEPIFLAHIDYDSKNPNMLCSDPRPLRYDFDLTIREIDCEENRIEEPCILYKHRVDRIDYDKTVIEPNPPLHQTINYTKLIFDMELMNLNIYFHTGNFMDFIKEHIYGK